MAVLLLINKFLSASSLVLPHASLVIFLSRHCFYISKKDMVFGAHSEVQLLSNLQKCA